MLPGVHAFRTPSLIATLPREAPANEPYPIPFLAPAPPVTPRPLCHDYGCCYRFAHQPALRPRAPTDVPGQERRVHLRGTVREAYLLFLAASDTPILPRRRYIGVYCADTSQGRAADGSAICLIRVVRCASVVSPHPSDTLNWSPAGGPAAPARQRAAAGANTRPGPACWPVHTKKKNK